MNRTEQVAAEYERRRKTMDAAGYHVDEFGYENLLIVEMFVADEHTREKLVRKQEGIAFIGLTPFVVECRKLMALERLANTVPRMWVSRKLRMGHEIRGK
jgi:hypothetical protein